MKTGASSSSTTPLRPGSCRACRLNGHAMHPVPGNMPFLLSLLGFILEAAGMEVARTCVNGDISQGLRKLSRVQCCLP